MDAPAVGDHVRVATDDHPEGVYRVVGTDGDLVLLEVGDADGRRCHTGRLASVASSDAVEQAEPPSRDGSPAEAFAGVAATGYWSVRAFLAELAARPVAAAAALALVVAGWLGEPALPLPEPVASLAVLAGALGLAAVGSGRL